MGAAFDAVLIDPLTNLFVVLTHLLFGNPGLGIVALTALIRGGTYPLQVRQMKATRAMAIISPRMQEINRRYKDPKRRQEETMKLYREAGVNPLGCVSTMVVQIPIFIALFSVFRLAFAPSPEALIELSERLYGWDYIRNAVPLNDAFLWLNLATPDPLVIPLLTALSTYVLQKMTTLPARDERQQAQNNMMTLFMPLIFAFITTTLPSGIGLYYVLSNVIGLLMQYVYVGGGPINWRGLLGLNRDAVLPRAVEVRELQIDSLSRRGSDEDEDEDDSAGKAARRPRPDSDGDGQAGQSNAARRRRRYGSGRRRGRR
jgi:YidC/Oxa1 family membrane protein insertase